MRNLWIGLLTLLARNLQTWSEFVSRRLENIQHSTANTSDAPQTLEESGIPVTDGQVIETHRPPADWSERVKAAQPPAHWRAKVSQAQVDSIKRVEPSLPDVQNESTPADSPIAPQRPADSVSVATLRMRPTAQSRPSARPLSQPNDRVADRVGTETQTVSEPTLASSQTIEPSRPSARDQVIALAKSAVPRSPFTPVSPTAAVQQTAPLAASEANSITPEVETSTSSDEAITARTQTAASQRERQPSTPMRVANDARTHSTTTDDEAADLKQAERLVSAKHVLPAPDRRASSMPSDSPVRQPTTLIDLLYPLEPLVQSADLASSPIPWPTPSSTLSPTLSPYRSDFAASQPIGNTLRSSQTWASITGQSHVEHQAGAIENQWPTLPAERVEVPEDFDTVWRERERLRRLDLEQRGLGWSA